MILKLFLFRFVVNKLVIKKIKRHVLCIWCLSFIFFVYLKGKKLRVEMLPTERALMGFLLAKIHKLDPDVIVVSLLWNVNLPCLCSRFIQFNVSFMYLTDDILRGIGDVMLLSCKGITSLVLFAFGSGAKEYCRHSVFICCDTFASNVRAWCMWTCSLFLAFIKSCRVYSSLKDSSSLLLPGSIFVLVVWQPDI